MTGSYPAPPPPLPPEEIPDEIEDVDMFKDSRRVVSDWIAERKIEEGIFIFACLVAAFLLIIFLKPIKKRYFKIEKREKP